MAGGVCVGGSHLVAAIAMAAAMIDEKCILSGCVLKNGARLDCWRVSSEFRMIKEIV